MDFLEIEAFVICEEDGDDGLTWKEVSDCIVSHVTLIYRIEVHARLLILIRNSPLHGLILVCTFINFEEFQPPAHS